MSTFQPHKDDLCTWVDEKDFFELDDEIQEADFTLDELVEGYKGVAQSLQKAKLHFAAIGGLAITVLGGRKDENMTHDVDFVFNGTVTQLFDVLRETKGLQLKKGLQADNFRVHCEISKNKWVGVDLLQSHKSVDGETTDLSGIQLLKATPLIAMKLKSFQAREAPRDASDIAFLALKFADTVRKKDLDKEQVDFFLEHAELDEELLGKVKKILE